MACRLPWPRPISLDPEGPALRRGKGREARCYRYGADELKAALGRPWERLIGPLVVLGCRRRLASFARLATGFDALVAARGLAAGSDWVLARSGGCLAVTGDEGVPREGPLVIAANHPGLLDTPAIAASLPRDDLRILASPHRFWEILPHLAERLILVEDESRSRARALRRMMRHLRAGGSLLLYPSGRIDPDPAVFGAGETRPMDWSGSLGLLARAVFPLTVVPTLVSGVLCPRALRHPLARLPRDPARRRWLAATLQFVGGGTNRLTMTTRVDFAPPVRLVSPPDEAELERLMTTVVRRMEALLDPFRVSASPSPAPDQPAITSGE